MTKEEFNTTKWYKGIKVRVLESQRVFEVDGVDFSLCTVSFWDGKVIMRMYCELVEVVQE